MTPRISRRLLAASVAGATALLCLSVGLASAHGRPAPKPVDLQLLSFNDFHGWLEPPTGTEGQLVQSDGTSIPAGGSQYLTTGLRNLRQGHKNTLTVAAGDLIGGSPFLSGLFHDEPAIDAMNNLGLDVTSVGNHEFDEGVPELLRMRYGGCNPTDGCFDSDGYQGTKFDYLAANVQYKNGVKVKAPKGSKGYGSWFKQPTGRTILPPTSIKTVQGIKVGFIGMTLEGTSSLVPGAGIKDVNFNDEVETGNLAARQLTRQGVKAIVVLLHEGGLPPSGSAYNYDCNSGSTAAISGAVVDIAKRLSPSIDMLVTGHTHSSYDCDIPDPAGHPRWVTSAASFGRVITETNLKLDPCTKDVIRSTVAPVNHPVTRDVTPAADQTANIAKWKALSDPVANRVIGSITGDILHSVTRDAESSLGDLVADAQLAATSDAADGGSVMAFMNSGGVRAPLTYASSAVGEGDGKVTYGEAFTVQPFGNLVETMTVTGAQIHTMLEEQWTPQADGSVKLLHLGVSKGFTYTRSLSAPIGSKVDPASIKLDGVTIDPAKSYRITVNSFLADGGDFFTVLKEGTDRLIQGVDLNALTAYLAANSPVTGPAANRVTIVP